MRMRRKRRSEDEGAFLGQGRRGGDEEEAEKRQLQFSKKVDLQVVKLMPCGTGT